MTLYELNSLIRELVAINLPDTYRIKAELSEVRVSAKGHCYVELVQKADKGQTPIAKARGVIMADTYPLLKLDFEETTGQAFQAGLEVLIEIKPTFNETYGYSLIIIDIDPTYTLGGLAKKRQEILKQLENNGVAHLQQELELPALLQRIAIISSPTAAGYGDFCHQLENNFHSYKFEFKLFQATMQGEQTESSIINALNQICNEVDKWDVVVIIRGGGAVSDLSGFETYNLANNCAQFPLPIITGIGHQRDLTIIDLVAHMHLKTPTAVSDFLISRMDQNVQCVQTLHERLKNAVTVRLNNEKRAIDVYLTQFEWFARNFKHTEELRIENLMRNLKQVANNIIQTQLLKVESLQQRLGNTVRQQITSGKKNIELLQNKIALHDPQRILDMGYSITLKNGKAIISPNEVTPGEEIQTKLKQGTITSIVK